MSELVEVLNAKPAEIKLAGIAERLANPSLAFGAVMRELEEGERSIFESYGGKYVKSGALMASLTENMAEGAVREILVSEMKFGTDIPYARFQGTQGPGDHQPPSAILKLTPTERAAVPITMMEHVMRGGLL